MRYQTSTIKPAHGGFGEWDLDRNQSFEPDGLDLQEVEQQARENVGEIYELGKDDLPEGIEDIRGSIHNEPTHVYGYLYEEHGETYPMYFGIDEIEVNEDPADA
jgi:hypothetical protein